MWDSRQSEMEGGGSCGVKNSLVQHDTDSYTSNALPENAQLHKQVCTAHCPARYTSISLSNAALVTSPAPAPAAFPALPLFRLLLFPLSARCPTTPATRAAVPTAALPLLPFTPPRCCCCC